MSDDAPMSDREQAQHFAAEIDKLVDRFRQEYDIGYMSLIGVLHAKAHLLVDEAYEDDGS